MKPHTLLRLAAGACLVGSAFAASAAGISQIQSSATGIVLQGGKAVVNFTVSGNASSGDRCGYFVEYGDGSAGDSRAIEKTNGQFTRPHQRIFVAPGTYTVQASGRNHKTAAACDGAASTVVTVTAAAPVAQWTPPACPEGWMLNERSVNQRTGAFNCSAKPAQELVCGAGLRYYERDGIIGCRAGRGSRDGRG